MTNAKPWCVAHLQRIGIAWIVAGPRPRFGRPGLGARAANRAQLFGVGSGSAGQVALTSPGWSGRAPVARYWFR
jgi:hypothetical protein